MPENKHPNFSEKDPPKYVPPCEKRYYPPGAAFLMKVCTKDKDHEGECGKGPREL